MLSMKMEVALLNNMLNSFINFINNLFSFKIYGNITIYDIFMFIIIISGVFTLLRILMERRN